MPTPEEVHDLKAQWCGDPVWDLEDTEGFEAHRDELAAFAKQQMDLWDAQAEARLTAKAESLGCPGNLILAGYVEALEARLCKIEAQLSA